MHIDNLYSKITIKLLQENLTDTKHFRKEAIP